MRSFLLFFLASLTISTSYGQQSDTLRNQILPSVIIDGVRIVQDMRRLDHMQGTYIYSGKKSEVIDLTQQSLPLSEKYGRQIFAKIPGVFVYDMDGTGNQMNISTRGLDPHRGWEFNIRKDGILTNSDMFGYPASHYNIPMEAVERIELVRGTSSLQYGAQFGGMLNYVSKQPDSTKPFAFESINCAGSYSLVSTYNSISGKLGKFRYSAWMNKKWVSGYRDNGDSKFNAEAVSLFYDFSKNLTLKVEYTHSNYIIHLAGALTDKQFEEDPTQSTRSRNYYNPTIHIPSFTLDWNVGANTKLRLTSSAVLGERNSVMFDKPTNVSDTIVTSTLLYNNRQVDIDNYNTYITEFRALHSYNLFKLKSTISAGVQYMNNDLHRRQLGKGTTGSDFDLSTVSPGWGRDLHFKTQHIAVFAENRWMITPKLSVNTGVRMEMGKSDLTGVITNYSDDELPNSIEHKFPLFGANAQYDLNSTANIYGGWAQAYRPVVLKDIIPASLFEKADKDLKDAYGYNADLGFRGSRGLLKWDVNAFYMHYKNRLGNIAQTDSANNLIIYRTNIGDSHTKGIELFLQADFVLGKRTYLSVFTSTSYMDARYKDATIRSGSENINVDGNKVESVPEIISRNGVTFKYGKLSLSALYSYTAESFADGLNAVNPNATASAGLVPAYSLVDMNIAVRISEQLKIQFNANNIFDESYFAKRPQFYPGPGIWPSDGRTFSGTVSIRL